MKIADKLERFERLQKQRRRASQKQNYIRALCVDYVRENYPDAYGELCEQAELLLEEGEHEERPTEPKTGHRRMSPA